jgi:hypothetical protein
MKHEWGKESYSHKCTRKERMGIMGMAESRDLETEKDQEGF